MALRNSKILIAIFIHILCTVHCSNNSDEALWTKLINSTQNWSKNFVSQQKLSFNKLFLVSNKSISAECNASISNVFNSIESLDDWSIRMVNSWGKFPPSGILEGTSSDFGAYDQCLSIEPNMMIEKPQYCMIDFTPQLPNPMPIHHNLFHQIQVLPQSFSNETNNMFTPFSKQASFFYWISVRVGICTPSICSREDIELMATNFAHSIGIGFKNIHCETKTATKLNKLQIIAMCIILVSILVTITASVADKLSVNKQTKSLSFLGYFSIRQNIAEIFGEVSSNDLTCIHGIRVVTIVWVIFSHSTEWTSFQLYNRTFGVKSILTAIQSQPLLNGPYAVENFFFISGLLTSFITLHLTKEQISRFSVIGFFVSRYLRLTPQLVIFIVITSLLPLLSSGPLWNQTITPIVNNCHQYWWRNLLYIQNLFKADDMCALQSWYLACDMQYHWISILIVLPMLYRIKFGFICSVIIVIAFYVISSTISYLYDLPPGLINTGRDTYFLDYYVDKFYIKPWSHGTVFFIGFAFGIIVYRKRFIKLTITQKCFAFLLTTIGYTTCLMDTYYWNTGEPYNSIHSTFVFSSCRVIWSLSIALLIWLCISGNAGYINKFLSAKLFVPLSRLTYSVYLTHVWIIWLFVGSRRERIDTNPWDIGLIFVHNLVLSYLIGFIFCALFEMPIFKLQKRLINSFIGTEKDIDCESNIQLNSLKITKF